MISAMLAALAMIQDAPAPPAPAPDLSAACPSFVPMTEVKIRVAVPINSRKARSGDLFATELAEDLLVDGRVLVPAGTPGIGEVINAAHPKMWGSSTGELILAARYLDLGAKRLPLRSFKMVAMGAEGRYWTGYTIADYGSNVTIPTGATASAKIAGACVEPVAAPAPVSTTTAK